MIAADVEELVVKYLGQFFPNVGIDMPPNPPMPFYLVTALASPTDWITQVSTVSVHAFASTHTAAAVAARAMHAKMNPYVFTPKLSFSLTSGVAGIDRFEVAEVPAWHTYEDPNLFRYCGRYRISLRVNQSS